MRTIASWLGTPRSTEYKVVAAMIATIWQAPPRDCLSPNNFRRQAHSAMAHDGSARAFAVNPARLTARPCGLLGIDR